VPISRPLPGSDALTYARGQHKVETLDAFRRFALHEHVERVLRRLLVTGAPVGELHLKPVAALFDLHSRTLNRRLRSEGKSFKTLLDETRHRVARQLLRDTQLPLQEMAITLGYADATALIRASRRWSGVSPKAWRTSRRRND
jgi:AraC-like DNA-binding protein